MQPLKICIVTQSHLSRNPRVLKEALALSKAGYSVTVINSTYSNNLSKEDKELTQNSSLKIISIASLQNRNIKSFFLRIVKRTADKMVEKFGFQTHLALGYASWQYKKAALKEDADLYICHQELGLYCGVQLLPSKKKVAFDFEDWYSEDLLEAARRFRPLRLLRNLERTALKEGVFSIGPSDAMCEALANAYQSDLPFRIYNTFDLDTDLLSATKLFRGPLKLFWFSQTIGPGRGLEPFFEIMIHVKIEVEIHLLGQISEHYKTRLIQILGQSHRIFFHPLVSPAALPAKIAEFDIGLALELQQPISRDVTITNKIFQYMLAGLPVIATPTAGQSEIFKQVNPGFLLKDMESPNLVKNLEDWLADENKLQNARQNAMKFARKNCWQYESEKIIKLVNDVQM